MITRRKRTFINHPKSNKNQSIINPKTGTVYFGRIDEIKNAKYYIPAGDILLKEGEHIGPNRGFGVQHIIFEHKDELARLGYTTQECVARFVSDVICTGAGIYCEFSHLTKSRVTVLKTSLGVVVIEERVDGQNNIFYSVVTAFTANRAHGIKIGAIQ